MPPTLQFCVLTCYKNNNTNPRQKFLRETNPVRLRLFTDVHRADTFLGAVDITILFVLTVLYKTATALPLAKVIPCSRGRLIKTKPLLRQTLTITYQRHRYFFRCRRHYKFIVLTGHKKHRASSFDIQTQQRSISSVFYHYRCLSYWICLRLSCFSIVVVL